MGVHSHWSLLWLMCFLVGRLNLRNRRTSTTKIGAVATAAMFTSKMKGDKHASVSADKQAIEAENYAKGMEVWGTWLGQIGVAQVVLKALKISFKDGEQAAFEQIKGLQEEDVRPPPGATFVRGFVLQSPHTAVLTTLSLLPTTFAPTSLPSCCTAWTPPQVRFRLGGADLGGLTEVIMSGVAGLADQAAPSGAVLHSKFRQKSKFVMAYGGLDVFFGGLEALLGPPQVATPHVQLPTFSMSTYSGTCGIWLGLRLSLSHPIGYRFGQVAKDPDSDNQQTIRKVMENEHTIMADATRPFRTTNGATSTSSREWEFAYTAKCPAGDYPEREGLAPEHWRT